MEVQWHSSESFLQEIPQPSVTKIILKIPLKVLHSNLSGTNESTQLKLNKNDGTDELIASLVESLVMLS